MSNRFEYLPPDQKVLIIGAWTKTVVFVLLGLALTIVLIVGASYGFSYLWAKPHYVNPLQIACQNAHGNWGWHANQLSCFFKENG